jgi:hypothetical protein
MMVARPFKAGISIMQIARASRSDALRAAVANKTRTRKPHYITPLATSSVTLADKKSAARGSAHPNGHRSPRHAGFAFAVIELSRTGTSTIAKAATSTRGKNRIN